VRAEIYERAVELDDDSPDDVCPGCGLDITGWRSHQGHYLPGKATARRRTTRRSGAANWASGRDSHSRRDWCEWTRDMLTARAFRRRYIARWRAQAVPVGSPPAPTGTLSLAASGCGSEDAGGGEARTWHGESPSTRENRWTDMGTYWEAT
jgi:hypothetical protein